MSYKRLESGVFKLPRVQAGARSVELRASELAMVLDGIDVSRIETRYHVALAPRFEPLASSGLVERVAAEGTDPPRSAEPG